MLKDVKESIIALLTDFLSIENDYFDKKKSGLLDFALVNPDYSKEIVESIKKAYEYQNSPVRNEQAIGSLIGNIADKNFLKQNKPFVIEKLKDFELDETFLVTDEINLLDRSIAFLNLYSFRQGLFNTIKTKNFKLIKKKDDMIKLIEKCSEETISRLIQKNIINTENKVVYNLFLDMLSTQKIQKEYISKMIPDCLPSETYMEDFFEKSNEFKKLLKGLNELDNSKSNLATAKRAKQLILIKEVAGDFFDFSENYEKLEEIAQKAVDDEFDNEIKKHTGDESSKANEPYINEEFKKKNIIQKSFFLKLKFKRSFKKALKVYKKYGKIYDDLGILKGMAEYNKENVISTLQKKDFGAYLSLYASLLALRKIAQNEKIITEQVIARCKEEANKTLEQNSKARPLLKYITDVFGPFVLSIYAKSYQVWALSCQELLENNYLALPISLFDIDSINKIIDIIEKDNSVSFEKAVQMYAKENEFFESDAEKANSLEKFKKAISTPIKFNCSEDRKNNVEKIKSLYSEQVKKEIEEI